MNMRHKLLYISIIFWQEELIEPLQPKLEHIFDESIPMTPPLTDEQVKTKILNTRSEIMRF